MGFLAVEVKSPSFAPSSWYRTEMLIFLLGTSMAPIDGKMVAVGLADRRRRSYSCEVSALSSAGRTTASEGLVSIVPPRNGPLVAPRHWRST